MKQRKLLLFLAVMLTGGLLAACGGDAGGGEASDEGVVTQREGESRQDYIDRLYEAAQEEGAVSYYQSADEEELQAIVDSFTEMFPEVEFEPVSATSGTILERALLESESGNVQGDVYGGGSGDQVALEEAGAIEEYRPVNEADVADEFKMDGPYIAVGYLSYHPAFNTDLVDEADLPDDWMGYCDEEWHGELAIDQEGAEWIAGLLAGMGEEDGMEFLECLAENEPRLVRGSTTRTELLASGEFGVMLDGYGHRLWEFEQEGAPIRTQRPSPAPLPVVLDMASMLRDAPHPNAARLLLEFFLTPEGQDVFFAQNKAGSLAGGQQEHPYGELIEDAELEVLEPGAADFDEAFQIFGDTFLGGGAPAP
ncbi:MAG: extracellular solute-binding protein [Propionibacteriales bacterium]|nr:extracellular solute-binding protein [Propionibacteriales bacterium]